MRVIWRTILAIPLGLSLAACASGGGGAATESATATPAGSPASASRGRNVITREEIDKVEATTALELIRRIRPQYLHTRGAVTGRSAANSTGTAMASVGVSVYLDETLVGSTDQLQQIPLADIREIRYYSASDATTKWGTGNTAGAIQVLLRR